MFTKLYTTSATATGGRDGHVKTQDGLLDADTRSPKELGGPEGPFLNPESLFAATYSTCFDGALRLTIKMQESPAGETTVKSTVSLGHDENRKYNIAVVMDVTVEGVSQEDAEKLVAAAHQICPYSNATRGNVEVDFNVTATQNA